MAVVIYAPPVRNRVLAFYIIIFVHLEERRKPPTTWMTLGLNSAIKWLGYMIQLPMFSVKFAVSHLYFAD